MSRERAGVSPVTVSRAIRHPDMVSPTLRKRVGDAVSLTALHPEPSGQRAGFDPHQYRGRDRALAHQRRVRRLPRRGAGRARAHAACRCSSPTRATPSRRKTRRSRSMLGYHPEAMIVIGVDQSERARQMLAGAGIPDRAGDGHDRRSDRSHVGFDHRAAGARGRRFLHGLGPSPHRPPDGAHRPALGAPARGLRMRPWRSWGCRPPGLIAASSHSTSVERGGRAVRRSPGAGRRISRRCLPVMTILRLECCSNASGAASAFRDEWRSWASMIWAFRMLDAAAVDGLDRTPQDRELGRPVDRRNYPRQGQPADCSGRSIWVSSSHARQHRPRSRCREASRRS